MCTGIYMHSHTFEHAYIYTHVRRKKERERDTDKPGVLTIVLMAGSGENVCFSG